MSEKRLYVGNLSYQAAEADLKELFGRIGGIEKIELMRDKRTHQPRGFAYVEMITAEDAREAIETLDETNFMGRAIKVSLARPRTEENPRRNGRRVIADEKA